jgi:hypothetical protein
MDVVGKVAFFLELGDVDAVGELVFPSLGGLRRLLLV